MSQTPISFGRLLVGFILISIGAGYLLQTMGYLPYSIIYYLKEFFWPAADLLIGIWFLSRTYRYSRYLKARIFSRTHFLIGISFLFASGALTLDRIGVWHFSVHQLFSYLWPILIILLGISLLFRSNHERWIEGKWGWNDWNEWKDRNDWKDWKDHNNWRDWSYSNKQQTENSDPGKEQNGGSGQTEDLTGSSGQGDQHQMNDYHLKKHELKQNRREWKRHYREWKRQLKQEWRDAKDDIKSNWDWNSLQRSSFGIGDLSVGQSEGWVFEDLSLRHLFGDVRLDLSHAIFQKDTHHLSIDSWAGDIRLALPMNLAVRIEADVWAGSIRLFSSRVDGIRRTAFYVSPNYNEAERKLHITISLKAGDIRVIRS